MLWSLVILWPKKHVTQRSPHNFDVLPPRDGLLDWIQPGRPLFEKIQKFCNEEAQDVTCPTSKPTAGLKKPLKSVDSPAVLPIIMHSKVLFQITLWTAGVGFVLSLPLHYHQVTGSHFMDSNESHVLSTLNSHIYLTI